MTIHPVFTLLLMGHVLGDFYLQTEKMARLKNKNWKWLAAHSVAYASCMALALFGGIAYSQQLMWLFMAVSAAHLAVDFLKRCIVRKLTAERGKLLRVFLLDQLMHLALLGTAWWIWREHLTVKAFVTDRSIAFLPESPVLILLGLLCVVRPIGTLINSGDIWDFSKNRAAPSESQKGAGRMIGYLERIIVFFLLISGQFTAIGFVMAAKSVIRFPEIREKGGAQAEYYLIGTLLSMTSVIVMTLLLGLVAL